MQLSLVGGCCVGAALGVLVVTELVAVVVAPVGEPALVVVAVVVPVVATVALAFLSLPERTISSAARNPTAIASAATSQVFEPLRCIAAAR
jgi:hypothetical protein